MPRQILEIPGPKAREVIARQEKYLATTTVSSPLVVKSAKGVWLTTVDDQVVLDGTSGVGVSNLGYGHEAIAEALIKELAQGVPQFIANDFPGEAASLLAEKLSQIVPVKRPAGGVAKTFFTNDGAGAIEAAIKLLLARDPLRNIFIALDGGFHGRTGFALPLMGSKAVHTRDFPMAYQVLHVPFPESTAVVKYEYQTIRWEHCLHAFLEKEYFGSVVSPERIGGIVLEIIQGEGGIRVISSYALEAIMRLAEKYGFKVIVDEIQTGWGRTGELFAFQHYGITPDIVATAKGFTQMVPGGAAIFGEDLDFREQGRHSGTFQGNALACRAALAVIAAFENGKLLTHVWQMGELLRGHAERFKYDGNCRHGVNTSDGVIRDVRGMGLMWGIEFVDVKIRDAFLHQALIRGLNLIGAGHPEKNPTVRWMPPLIITEDEINEMFAIAKEAMGATLAQ